MTILYKLTDQDGYTRRGEWNECLWAAGVSHSGTGEGGLCGPGHVHAYESPLLAVLLNPIHAGIANPRLWEAEGEIALRDGQLKCECVTLTTLREIPVPVISCEQRMRFGILCAKAVYANNAWNNWADNWLSGKDRSIISSRKAACLLRNTSNVNWAIHAAWEAAQAALAAPDVRQAAIGAAWASKSAAKMVEETCQTLDLITIAKQAMEEG
jgi:hypothetical protein